MYEKLATGLAQIAKLETELPLPRLIRQNENRNLSTCSSKFEMKAATYFEQTVNKYSNIVTTTLQSSHQIDIRFTLKSQDYQKRLAWIRLAYLSQ